MVHYILKLLTCAWQTVLDRPISGLRYNNLQIFHQSSKVACSGCLYVLWHYLYGIQWWKDSINTKYNQASMLHNIVINIWQKECIAVSWLLVCGWAGRWSKKARISTYRWWASSRVKRSLPIIINNILWLTPLMRTHWPIFSSNCFYLTCTYTTY